MKYLVLVGLSTATLLSLMTSHRCCAVISQPPVKDKIPNSGLNMKQTATVAHVILYQTLPSKTRAVEPLDSPRSCQFRSNSCVPFALQYKLWASSSSVRSNKIFIVEPSMSTLYVPAKPRSVSSEGTSPKKASSRCKRSKLHLVVAS